MVRGACIRGACWVHWGVQGASEARMGGLSSAERRSMTGRLTCRFRASLNHKEDGQTKFIKPNSQR